MSRSLDSLEMSCIVVLFDAIYIRSYSVFMTVMLPL
jgi:hypothetical protein